MSAIITVLAFGLLIDGASVAGDPKIAEMVDVPRLVEILGAGWKRDRGIVIESKEDAAKLEGAEKELGEMILKAMEPHGVVACGDFSFSRTQSPLNNVTIRVFKFSSDEKAAAWREAKYESEKAKPFYKKSAEGPLVIFDSVQMKKRIVFDGVYVVTCEHIGEDDLHLKVLKECVKVGMP